MASVLDVTVVHARMRHGSAQTTIDTYRHWWPDSDDNTRAAISSVIAARRGLRVANLRTEKGG